MNEQEVKNIIGEESWDLFMDFMTGQTVGITKDGKYDYCIQDVETFMEILRIK